MYSKYVCKLEGHKKSPLQLLCMHRQCNQKSRFLCKECITQELHNGDYRYDPFELASEQLLDITLNLKKMSLENASSHFENYFVIQSKIEILTIRGSLKRLNILKETMADLRQKIKNHQETNLEKYLSVIEKTNVGIDQYMNHYQKEIYSYDEKHKRIEEKLNESRKNDEQEIEKLKTLVNIKIDDKITEEIHQTILSIKRSDDAMRITLDECNQMTALGERLHYQQQYEKSITVLQEALLLNSHNWEAYDLIASNLRSLRLYNDAISNHNKAIEIYPTFGFLYNNKGITLDYLYRYDESLMAYEKALQLDPTLVQALQNKTIALRCLFRYEEALAICDQCIQQGQKEQNLFYNKGICLMDLGRYQEAINVFDQGIKIDPDYYNFWYKKGMVFYNMKKYDEAIKNLEKAQKLMPSRFDPTKFIIRSYVKKNQIEKAFNIFNGLIQQNQKSQAIYSEKASTHLQLKQYDAAIKTYLPVIAANPSDPFNLFYLSRVYFAQGKYDETLKYLDNLIYAEPRFTHAYYIKGKIFRNQKKYNEALNMFNKAFAKTIDDAQVHGKIAEIYILQGQYDDALTSLDNALKIHQICPYCANNKGNVKMLKQEYEQAIIWYQKAILYNQDSRQEMFEYLEQYELFTKDQEISSLIQNAPENLKIAERLLNQQTYMH
ncbi:hypothetical protein pb186bvf_018941 [Paramecium bursaria]